MALPDAVKTSMVNNAVSPSTWLAVLSGVGAIAQTLTASGEPHLVMIGAIAAAVFKVAEAAHDAYVKGKKLDVEKQLVHVSGAVPPSVVVSAKAAGLDNLPMTLSMPTPKLDGVAPVVDPTLESLSDLPPGVSRS